MFLEPHRFS